MKKTNKLISILLVLAMMLTMAPISVFAAGSVASVTDASGNAVGTYATLDEAVTAAEASEGSTVTLLDNITLTDIFYFRKGKLTLDLNGKTLRLEGELAYLRIQADADVTIKDSGAGGTIENTCEGYSVIFNNGILTVESGTIKGDAGIQNSNILNFKNGTVETVNYDTITNYGTTYVYDGTLKSSDNSGITNNSGCELYIYGGDIVGGTDAIENHANAYISGGNLKGNSYAALNLLGGPVEITGGSFTGTDNEYGFVSGTPYGEWTVRFYEGAPLTLKGGEFPGGFVTDGNTANALLAEGYAFYDKDGNKITVADDATSIAGYVQVKELFAASVTDKDGNEIGTYKTFGEAVTAAQNSEGSTLTLLDNITLTETQYINSGRFTLDLNGKTLLNESEDVLRVEPGADLTVKDSGTGGAIESTVEGFESIENAGTLTVESGTFKGIYAAISSEGCLVIENGTFEGNYAVYMFGGSAKFNNGTFNGDVWSFVSYEINGGEYTADCIGINAEGGTLTITGGKFDIAEMRIFRGKVVLNGGEFTNGFTVSDAMVDSDEEQFAKDVLAEGYAFYDKDGNKITVADDATSITGYVQVKEYFVASVTDASGTLVGTYATLAEAVTAAQNSEGSTLTLLDNITLTEAQNIGSGRFTLDLNGKTLLNESADVLRVKSGADLTVKDSGTGGTIESTVKNYAAIKNEGTLTVESGTFKGDFSVRVSSNASTKLNGGTFYGIVWGFASYEINGGEYTADYIGINAENEVFTVNGGSFDINIIRIYSGKVVLNGGEFTNGFTVSDSMDDSDEEQFANDILAEGYAFYDKDGNKITVGDDATSIYGYVQVKELFAASVTDKDGNSVGTYATLAEAVTAAQNSEGSTLTLLDNITLTEAQHIGSGRFTLDLNGKTLLNESTKVLRVELGADLTVKDSGTGGAIESTGEGYAAIENAGTLTVESGTIKGDTAIRNSNILNFKNGTAEAVTYNAINNYGTAYVYDGTLKSSYNSGITNNSGGELYIYGGDIVGDSGAVTNHANAYISGGNLKGNSYAALILLSGPAEITGGSFTGTDYHGFVSGTPYGEWTVDYIEGATLTLRGGEFPGGFVSYGAAANTFLAEGYFYRDADGKIITVADDTTKIDGYVKVTKGAEFETEAVVILDETEIAYTGEECKPAVTVKVGGVTLKENTHYTVAYANNINAGTAATVTVTGKGDYSGEIVTNFTIYVAPSSFITLPAAKELIYNGTAQELITAGETNDGEIQYSLDGITYSTEIPTGTDADEYTVYYKVIGDENHIDTEPAEITVTIKAKDISDGSIILGDALTYNGKEQTQEVAGVEIPAGLDVTYTVSDNKATNVGVYLLKVTGTGNFTGEAMLTFEIAVDMNGVDFEQLHFGNVKSTDKESIEYIYNQVDNAVRDYADTDKQNEYDNLKSTCVELLKMIESVANRIESFKNKLAEYDINTVTSDDDADLESFYNDEVAHFYDIYFDNLTEEQTKELDNILSGISALRKRISDVANEITRIEEAVNGYDTSTVKSTDKADLEQLLADINALTTGKNITDTERADLIDLANTVNWFLAVIGITADEIKRITDAVNAYDEATVKSTDKADIEKLISDIKALTDAINITEDEKTALEALDATADALIKKIDDTAAEISRIEEAVNAYDETSVKSSDKSDIEKLINDIKALTDGQNITDDERAILETADETCDNLLAKIAETKSEYDRVIDAANGYDEATVTSADKDALVKLNEDIYALALTDNVTAEEKANLQAAHNDVLALIDKITGISGEIKRIIEKVDAYVFESVKSSDKADIEKLIADIKALLDGQNITADERTLLETADETCDKLIAKIDETVAEINRINEATNAYDEATVTSADKADIEKLIADIKVLTDGDNITDDERAQLTNNDETLDALLAKINATAEEIARIEEAVNAYDEATVKSTNKADIEKLINDIKALTDATSITEEEKAALEALDATADELVKKIDETAAEISRINEAVNAYNAETVTSADIPEIGKLIEDIKALTDGDNLTEDEKAALAQTDSQVDVLVEKLEEVAEEIKKADEAVKSYDEDTVKSSDCEDLANLKNDIQALIDSTNTTENEKTALEEMIKNIEGLENKVEETEEQLEEIKGIENNFNPESVSSDDKSAIEEKIAEIEAVNPDNLTDEQKAEYNEIKAGFDALLEEIKKAEKSVADIGVELEMFDEERVTIFWEDDIEALKAKIDGLLADENMGEAEKAKLNEYKAQCDKLIEIINTPKEYFSLRLFYFIWDCLNWKFGGIIGFFRNLFGC